MLTPIEKEQRADLFNLCNTVLDDYNAKKITKEQMNARMTLLHKKIIAFETKVKRV